ncbi:hypothetical protein BSFA1_83610 (plasmid) [Burkholderia sp. SFA1]|nr:hypothetical protein BSFA1_83610 [Burkholderia sp. SFA1]
MEDASIEVVGVYAVVGTHRHRLPESKDTNFEPLKAAVYTVKRRFFDKNYIARPVFACPSTA